MEGTPAPVTIETLLAHREWVRRVALVLVRNDEGAADLEQDLWVKVLRDPPRVRGSLRGWLAATLRNDFLNRRRGDLRRAARERSAARPEGAASAADLVADAEALRRVVNAVMDLEEPYRTTVLHRFYEDLAPGEIAARQGIPVETVRTRLKRAVAQLRERFDEESRGDRSAWCAALAPLIGRTDAALAPAASALTVGGLLMTNKALAAGVVVLLLAGGGWFALGPGSSSPRPMPGAPPVRAGAPARPVPVVAPEPPPESAAGGLPAPVDLTRCDRDRDLFGVVVDGGGAPVPGAAVQVENYPWQGVHQLNHEHYRDMVPGPGTLSAADGTFRLRLGRGDSVAVRVRKEGLAERFLSPVLAGERLRVVLARGADLEVSVVDGAGAPVPGAGLRLWRVTPSYGMEIERTGTTDARGRYLFEALSPGPATLSTDPPGRAVPQWQHPDIQAGKTVSVEVQVPEARIVEGTVTDAVTGKPIAGARVGIGWTMERPVVTGSDGTYRMAEWAPKQGRPDLHARAEGYVGLGIEVPEQGALDFTLRPGDSVSGRLLDPQGRTVAGARISVLPPDRKSAPPPGPEVFDALHGVSGPDGTILLRGLDHGAAFHGFVATAEDLGRIVIEFPPAAAEGGTVDLGDVRFPAARAIEGTLSDPAGRPAAGVGVFARGGFPDRGTRMPGGGPVSATADLGSTCSGRTDDLGRFRFRDLAPGPWHLSATPEGAPRIEKDVVLPPDRDLLDVRLGTPAGTTTTLKVFLLTEAGEPVEGVVVYLSPEGKEPLQKTSNAKGFVLFQGLAPREYTLQVPDYGKPLDGLVPPPMEKVTPAGQEMKVVLREAGEVRGVVVDTAGNPLPWMLVQASLGEDRGSPFATMAADEHGEFVLKAPRGCPVRVFLYGTRALPRDPKADPRIPVAGPEPTGLRGEVKGVVAPVAGVRIVAAVPKADRTLEVLLLDLDDRPLPGIRTWLQTQPPREARSGADGKVRFQGLVAERMQLMVLPDEDVVLAEDVVPPLGQWVEPAGQSLTVRFTRGVVFKGRVLMPDGTPAAGARISCFATGKAFNSAKVRTNAAGRFRVGVPPDTLMNVAASLEEADDTTLTAWVTSVDPAAGEVEMRLHPLVR